MESYKEGIFSSRHITRPEAVHPLVIAASAIHSAYFGPKQKQIILGLPAGSTELAYAHAIAEQMFQGELPEVLLFPVSFHSSKIEFDREFDPSSAIRRWISRKRSELEGKRVVIVDDNSSTGRTIQAVVDAVSSAEPESLDFCVAEADVIRSTIDLENEERRYVASRQVYDSSISVLPVSRKLQPKTDLKEILELRKMRACTEQRYFGEGRNFRDRVIGSVYVDLLENPTERILAEIPEDQMIRKFQGGPLSNFARIEVRYLGEAFNSVEHAYQSTKFNSTVWTSISEKDIEAINRKIRDDDETVEREDLPHIFSRQSMSPGASKKVANYLRILGHVRQDWDDVKVPTMIELLIQKYADPNFFDLLQSTKGMYLIEGNDWNDTFWGECNGRGRNFLGRALMALRRFEIQDLREAADEIRSRLL